jgi:exodeoxyribonuclease-5
MVDFKALARRRADKRQLDLPLRFDVEEAPLSARAAAALKEGLASARRGEIRPMGDFAKYADPAPVTAAAILSDDQRPVIDGMIEWADGRGPHAGGILTVGGLAGVGKTTVVGVFAAIMQERGKLVAYATFTGRAASVLQRKLTAAGVRTTNRQARPENFKGRDVKQLFLTPGSEESQRAFGGTIHKLLYRPLVDDKEELHGWAKRDTLDRKYDLIVVDEASQIGDDLLLDLQKHRVPILAVGDHGQLPPVMSSGNLMAKPALKLTKIHRQARDNPIIRFARHVRKTGELSTEFEDGDHIAFDSKRNVDVVLQDAYANVDSPLDVAILCWTNKSRIRLNLAARKVLGFKGTPSKGELLICLKNMRNQNADIYNGMRGVVAEDTWIGDEGWELEALVGFPEENILPRQLTLCAPQFNRERVFGSVDELNARGVAVETMAGMAFADFGYALTCHRAQGSQMKHVVVWIEEGAKSDATFWKRWLYTAVTRSSERLTCLL